MALLLLGLALLLDLAAPGWAGDSPWRTRLLPGRGSLGEGVLPFLAILAALACWRWSYRLNLPTAAELTALDPRPPVVYLGAQEGVDEAAGRPGGILWRAARALWGLFRTRPDTPEQRLVARLGAAGPVYGVVAEGQASGTAAGAPLRSDGSPEWQVRFSELLSHARLVALRPGATRALAWEAGQVQRSVPPERLLLLLPRDRLVSLAGTRAALQEWRGRFPTLDIVETLRSDVVSFDADGNAQAHRRMSDYVEARFGATAGVPRWQRGFGLSGRARTWIVGALLIVAFLVGSVYLLAVPALLDARLGANEVAAVSTLRGIVAAQAQFHHSEKVDLDRDARGEYGGFLELSGAERGRMTETLNPPILSAAFRVLSASGEVSRSGYLFRIYLPGPGGVGVAETANGFDSRQLEADLSEQYWVAYAWPAVYGSSGRRTFFVNQQGEVLAADDASYTGSGRGPRADAAFRRPGTIVGDLANGVIGADRNTWTAVQ